MRSKSSQCGPSTRSGEMLHQRRAPAASANAAVAITWRTHCGNPAVGGPEDPSRRPRDNESHGTCPASRLQAAGVSRPTSSTHSDNAVRRDFAPRSAPRSKSNGGDLAVLIGGTRSLDPVGCPPLLAFLRPGCLVVRLSAGGLVIGVVAERRLGPTISASRRCAVRMSPASLSVQASVVMVPWTKTRSPLLSDSAMLSARVLNARTAWRVGSPSPAGGRHVRSSVGPQASVDRFVASPGREGCRSERAQPQGVPTVLGAAAAVHPHRRHGGRSGADRGVGAGAHGRLRRGLHARGLGFPARARSAVERRARGGPGSLAL